MTVKVKQLAGLLLLGFGLVGCVVVKKIDSSNEYRKVENYDRALLVPAGLAGQIDDLYVIPRTQNQAADFIDEPLPPTN